MSLRKDVEKELGEIKEIYGAIAEHNLFAIWAIAKLHLDGDIGSEQTLEDAYAYSYQLLNENGPGDHKLDGYYYDEASNKLFLYQAVWPNKETTTASQDKACEVATALIKLDGENLENGDIGETRGEVVKALQRVVEEGGEIILRGITGGKWNLSHHSEIAKRLPANLRDKSKIELLDLKAIYKEVAQRTDDLAGETIEFALLSPGNDVLNYPGPSYRGLNEAILSVVSGKSLAEIGRAKGVALYERNVRHFLGNKRINSALKPLISDCASWPALWYGHNGITVICDGFNFVPKSGKAPAKIAVQNPQIVNGCQTVSTLAESLNILKTIDGDFGVSARFIKVTGDADTKDECAGLIAYATNNQAAVVDADLLSNHPTQKSFQMKLAGFDNGWFYERKRGEWKALSKAKKQKFKVKGQADRFIGREQYQQAFRAYEGKPAEAITKKNAVWFEGGAEFSSVFALTRRGCDIVLVVTLFDWFSQVFRVKNDAALCADINTPLAKHVTQIKRARHLLAAHSVALYGYVVTRAYNSLDLYPEADALKVINGMQRGSFVSKTWNPSGKKNSWAAIDAAVRRIMKAWGYYLNQELKDGASLYGALKSPDAFEALKQLLDNDVSGDGINFVDLLR